MTEQWLLQDINKLIQHRNRVVVLDPTGQCSFVVDLLQKQYQIIQTDSAITEQWQQQKEELLLRCDAETTYADTPVIFYVTRPQEKLSFLFDYCFTHGCLDLSHPQEWLKKKIFTYTSLQVPLDNPMLLTAAKLGIGKDIAWWKKIVQNLEEVIDLDAELLPFVHNPEEYLSSKDTDIRRLFEEKIYELLDMHHTPKSAKTLADEVVKMMLDGLANNEIKKELLQLYYKWADSTIYRTSLDAYIRNYKLSSTINPWSAHPDHCFEKLDQQALKQIVDNSRDRSFITDKLHKLKKRIFSAKASLFVPSWWNDVWQLFNTDIQPLNNCRSLNAFIEYYTANFHKTDRAIRNLYITFLNSETIIRPLQEYYEGLNHVVLQTWFGFYKEYKSDQQGYLPNLIGTAKPKTAVIVGDGVRYEIASYVADELQKHYHVEKQVMLADMPSETEHNMSALYVGNNEVLADKKDREKKLSQITGKAIEYLELEQTHYGVDADYLVLTYKDIDKAGETLQQAAIKLFGEFETVLIEKITLLLNMGYAQVYLVTDHGFVLTGLLDEADKIDPNVAGKKEVHERFIRAEQQQSNAEWLEFPAPYGTYKFVYAAKNHRPFKSKGVYGYAHGGFTPQEIIIPKFVFSRAKSATSSLDVVVTNKQDLTDVTGELFAIKIQAKKSGGDLFASQRKVQIKLYAGSKEYQSSTIVIIDAGKSESIECSFNQNTSVQAVLLDAVTQEQLDKVTINKSNLRDLGGLI